jgi:hypothetical protein
MYAFTKVHNSIAPNIFTNAGVCALSPDEDVEYLAPDAPEFQWRRALWDTGATLSCISDRFANELSLEMVDFVEIGSAVGVHRVPMYRANLSLPNNLVFHDMEFIQFTYTDDDCDLIIGMDIMTQGDLSMTNQEGRTVFSFRIPSLHTVDFEARNTHNPI